MTQKRPTGDSLTSVLSSDCSCKLYTKMQDSRQLLTPQTSVTTDLTDSHKSQLYAVRYTIAVSC